MQFEHYIRFVSRDLAKNRNRFYLLSWQPELDGSMMLVCTWGRIGTRCQSRVICYPERVNAQETAEDSGQVEHDTPINIYHVVIEREVGRQEDQEKQRKELYGLQKQAFRLIHELQLVWPFIFGSTPSTPIRTLKTRNAPQDWSSNSRELFYELHPSKYNAEASIEQRDWAILPYMPLPRLLHARLAYKCAPVAIKTLIELNYDALDANEHAAMFLLAKALELVRALLPGKDDKARMKRFGLWLWFWWLWEWWYSPSLVFWARPSAPFWC